LAADNRKLLLGPMETLNPKHGRLKYQRRKRGKVEPMNKDFRWIKCQ
jgi:hypothetical protein